MGAFPYEEVFGCYSNWDFLPHVQDWAILPQSDMGHSIEVCGMDVQRVALILKIMMNLHDIEIKDTSNVFFDIVSGVSNTRYFKSQEIALELGDEEQHIN